MSKDNPTQDEITPAMQRLFATRDGQLVLKYLDRRYYDAKIKQDELERAVGRRDVVLDIHRTLEKTRAET